MQRLPVLFIVENNRYSVYSPPEVRRHPKFSLCDLAVSLGASSSQHDGNDALAVQQAINNAVNAIRAGSGPSVLEFSVYRWREHCGPNYDNDIGYRTEEEFLAWKALEPVQMLRNALSNVKEDLVQIEAEWAIQIKQEIKKAFAFAEQSSFPDCQHRLKESFVYNDSRELTYAQAINEAIRTAMSADDRVICYGLGVPDPKGVFGTTTGLAEQFGTKRVFDVPTSENAFTGVGIGASMTGLLPIMTHQRLDFFLLAIDQLVNAAASGISCLVIKFQFR